MQAFYTCFLKVCLALNSYKMRMKKQIEIYKEVCACVLQSC